MSGRQPFSLFTQVYRMRRERTARMVASKQDFSWEVQGSQKTKACLLCAHTNRFRLHLTTHPAHLHLLLLLLLRCRRRRCALSVYGGVSLSRNVPALPTPPALPALIRSTSAAADTPRPCAPLRRKPRRRPRTWARTRPSCESWCWTAAGMTRSRSSRYISCPTSTQVKKPAANTNAVSVHTCLARGIHSLLLRNQIQRDSWLSSPPAKYVCISAFCV